VKLEEEEEEEIAKSRLEELKSRLGLRGNSMFATLLHGIMRTVLEESKVRLAEEMISFRKSIADQLLNCSEHQMNEEVNLLKLDGSFRAAWNKWLETPHEQRAEEAYKVFESCLFKKNSNQLKSHCRRAIEKVRPYKGKISIFSCLFQNAKFLASITFYTIAQVILAF